MQTTSLVSARLPTCLSAIVIDYFGRRQYAFEMAMFGQWEDCINFAKINIWASDLIYGSCCGGYIDMIIYFLPNIKINLNLALTYACRHNKPDIVNLMISLGADGFNRGLVKACYHGHLAIAEMMVAHGADDFNDGLACACTQGHRQIVKLMIARGATRCIGLHGYAGCKRPADAHLV